jgi:hypothetical protein
MPPTFHLFAIEHSYGGEQLIEGQALEVFAKSLQLHDIQAKDPETSMFIGKDDSHLDYMFGCANIQTATVQQGTLVYSVGPSSDHWGVFVDLEDIRAILGTNVNSRNMVPSSARLLKSGHPESVLEYPKSMQEYYADHKMISRIRNLTQEHEEGASTNTLEPADGLEIKDEP